MNLAPLRLGGLRGTLLAMLLVSPLSGHAADQQVFATPEAAADALLAALKTNDDKALLAIVGREHKNIVSTGDPAADAVWRSQAVTNLETFRAFDDSVPDRRVLLIGAQSWPLPIPLVREGTGWRYATEQGVEEILNRRVGANERSAIHVLHAYLDAQRTYASRDRQGDGVLQYARKLASTPGRRDGLYWPAESAQDGEESPFGPLISESAPHLAGHGEGDAFRGYHFRILSRQGKNAPGGPYNYVINDRMIAGFAMVAYPAAFGKSGVMTFLVSQNGKVYEKNLGPDSVAIGARMVAFDPGPGWKETTP